VLSVGDKRGEWREDIAYEKVVFPMAKRVADDRYAIGYSGVAYLDQPLKVIPVSEGKGKPYEAPTYEGVAAATYPLSRVVFFNTNKPPGKPLNPALDEFLRFVLSREGQQVVLDHARYIPLRNFQAQDSRALLAR
jgi:phosphate transport system substrate-binding protein